VEFVDEDDDVFVAADFVHDRFDAFFELTAVFCSRHDEGEVEGEDFFIPEDFGDIAADNFGSEAFGDGGFADAGFADEDGVIFCAAAEDLDDAFDLV